MNHEIEELFYGMFPELFRGRFKSVEESLMCYGMECDNKWFFLLWQTDPHYITQPDLIDLFYIT